MDKLERPEAGQIRQSQAFLWVRIIVVQIITLLLGVLLAIILGLVKAGPAWAVLGSLIIDVILVAIILVDWKSLVYVIRDDVIIIRRSLFGVREGVYQTDKISTVRIIQSAVGRAFDYGTIEFEYAETGEEIISLYNIDNPQLYERILKHMSAIGQPGS
jgi:uncharacterized membrane protein YdbT with pleckstrin-like domain